eukprot:7095047-Pyramimonas_sp.AAC.1
MLQGTAVKNQGSTSKNSAPNHFLYHSDYEADPQRSCDKPIGLRNQTYRPNARDESDVAQARLNIAHP